MGGAAKVTRTPDLRIHTPYDFRHLSFQDSLWSGLSLHHSSFMNVRWAV